MEAPNASESPSQTPEPGLSPSYGPFTTAAGALVSMQQVEGAWQARVVQKVGFVVQEQHLAVGCLDDTTKIVAHLQGQSADYIKSRIHVLSEAQSPTGKGSIYLGRLGLRGGMDSLEIENNTSKSIHQASQVGELVIIQSLVQDGGVDVNAKDEDARTALHYAAKGGHLETLKYLVGKGAEVNARDIKRKTALHYAAQGGHLELLQYLVEEKGAEVDTQNKKRKTALHYAAQEGQLKTLKYLVEKGAEVNARDKERRKTALHYAAQEGHLETLKYLVERGAEVNTLDKEGKTALHYAATRGHLEILQYLVEKGAEVNDRDQWGATVLHYAAEKGDLEPLKYLVAKGAEVNARDKEGKTALHYAALEGDLEPLKYLVEKGAEVNTRNKYGETVIHYAALEGNLEPLKYLVEKGAEVNTRNKGGKIALHYAADHGNIEAILYLIEEGGSDIPENIANPRDSSPGKREWEYVDRYILFTKLADALHSKQDCRRLFLQEHGEKKMQEIIEASRKLKFALKYKDGQFGLIKECPHDMRTAFSNRFKNRMSREGVPEAMLLDPKKYFEDLHLPDCLKEELQTFIRNINAGREGFILQASGIVALLGTISPTPLSIILCPPEHFRSYDPQNSIQKRAVEFYTQRSPELRQLIGDAVNINNNLSKEEIERELCQYLPIHLSKLEPDDESFQALARDSGKKDQLVQQISDILAVDTVVVFPTRLKSKLKQVLKELLKPNVPRALEEIQDALRKMEPHLLSNPHLKDAYKNLESALSLLGCSAPSPEGPLPPQQGIVQQRKEKRRRIGD
jgi:ankyrin repeat protein